MTEEPEAQRSSPVRREEFGGSLGFFDSMSAD